MRNYFVNFCRQLLQKIDWKITLKLGITASLTLFLTTNFGSLSGNQNKIIAGMWSVVASLYIIQAHLGGTYIAARTRIIGIFLGSALGALFTSLFGAENLALGISVSSNVAICYLLGLKESIYVSSMSLVVVNILWKLNPEISPWEFGLLRMFDSAIGIAIGLGVAHYFWPTQATGKLRQNLAKTFRKLNELFLLVTDFSTPHLERKPNEILLIGKIFNFQKENQTFLLEARHEILSEIEEREVVSLLIEHAEELYQSLIVLRTLHTKRISKIFDETLTEKFYLLREHIAAALISLANKIEGIKSSSPLKPLNEALKQFNSELLRFRSSKKTRDFDLEEVEGFFFFLYSIKSLVFSLDKFEKSLSQPILEAL